MNETRQEHIARIIGLLTIGFLLAIGFMSTRNMAPVYGQALTTTGPMPGVMFIFNSSGTPMSQFYCTMLTGTSTTSGTFSVTGTGPLQPGTGAQLWTSPGSAWVDNVAITSAGTSNVNQAYTPYPSTLSVSSNTITVSGTVRSPTTLLVLGATAINSAVAEPVVVRVCSN